MDAGNAALKEGDDTTAIQLFKQVVERDSKNVVGYYDLGVAYQRDNERRDALSAYARALSFNSKFAPAIFARATMYGTIDPGLAMFLYRKVISIQPSAATAYFNLGLLEAQNHQAARAAYDLSEAIRLRASLIGRLPTSLRPLLRRTTAGPTTTTTSSPNGK